MGGRNIEEMKKKTKLNCTKHPKTYENNNLLIGDNKS